VRKTTVLVDRFLNLPKQMHLTDQQNGTLRTFRAAACTAVVLALSWSQFGAPDGRSDLQDYVSGVRTTNRGFSYETTRITKPLLATLAAYLPLTVWLTRAACGALGLISTTAAASNNKEIRQTMDWAAELVAAWTRCGMQLAVAADIWHQTSTPTLHPYGQQLHNQSQVDQAAVGLQDAQLPLAVIQQMMLATLLLNQTVLHVLHPVHELAAASLECLLLLVNVATLTWRLQDAMLLAAPKLLVLTAVTRLGPAVLVRLWTVARAPCRQQQQQRQQQHIGQYQMA
jgi:hypothetical protein